jgi:MFS family permease
MRPITARYARFALGILFAVNLIGQLDRNILASLLPLIKSEYAVSDQWTGLLGASFIWVFMLTALPFGHWADRSSRTRIIGGGLATWSAATAASGLVPSFAALFATRAVVGIGEASAAAAAPSMIADYFPPQWRTRALSAYFVAGPVGAGLGFILGGLLGEAFGWRHAFLFAAVPGLALTAMVLALREPARGLHDASKETGTVPLRHALRRLLAIRTYLAVVATGTLVTFAIGGVAVWLPTYLVRAYAMSLAEAGTISGIAVMIGALSGTIAGGIFAERLSRRSDNALVHTIAFSLAVTALLLPIFFYVEQQAALLPIMIIINFFLFWHIGPINTLIANVSPPNVRGVAISLQILTIHLLGDAFSPALIGAASDTLQARGVEAGEALRSVLLFLLPVPVFLAALCSEIAGLWAPADMRRVVGDPAAHGNAELVVAAGH